MNENKTNINYYPGHMTKAKREIKEKIDLVDVVVLVLDARIPKSSYVKDIDEFTKSKKKIIVFSKYDLCDRTITLKWKEYYEKMGYVVLLSEKSKNIKNDLSKALNLLMKYENDKRKLKGLLPKKCRIIVVGVSNVGKSSLINKISGRNSLIVGNKPGVTKSISIIKVDNDFELLDTPGVLWPKFDNEEIALNLASMSIIKEDILRLDQVAIHILQKLSKLYPELLFKNLGIDRFEEENIDDYYKKICKFRNIPIVKEEINYDKVNELIVNLMKNEVIKSITFDEL